MTDKSSLSESSTELSQRNAGLIGSGLGVLSTFLTWYSATFIVQVKVSGINTDPGIIFAIGAVFALISFALDTPSIWKYISMGIMSMGILVGVYYLMTISIVSMGIGFFVAVLSLFVVFFALRL